MIITNVEIFGKNTKMPIWGLRWRNLAPEKFRDDVWSKRFDRHNNEIFEMQIPIKFHPNQTIESKVMILESPCIMTHLWFLTRLSTLERGLRGRKIVHLVGNIFLWESEQSYRVKGKSQSFIVPSERTSP